MGGARFKYYYALNFRGKFTVPFKNHTVKLYNFGGSLENEIFWKGLFESYEADTGWVWSNLSKDANVILDIGANMGLYSVVSRTLNPKAKIIAFEPSRFTYKKLLRNSSINDNSITCEQIALSDTVGFETFFDSSNPEETSGSLSNQMLKGRENIKGNLIEYDVEVMTLDNYIANNQLTQIDLIKLDVELMEPKVLMGFKLFDTFKPFVLIEVLNEGVANELNSMFNSSDYCFYLLTGKNQLVEQPKFKPNPNHFNYLFFRKEKKQKAMELLSIKL